jgi:hypothetical protein
MKNLLVEKIYISFYVQALIIIALYIIITGFYIESTASMKRTTWLQLFIKILYISDGVKIWKDEELIVYFLYRINEEIRDNIQPSENYLKNIYVAAQKISEYLKLGINS